MEVTRRGFLGMASAAALASINTSGFSALAQEATEGNKGLSCPWGGPGSEKGDWVATPDEVVAIGGCTMPLDELNRRRQLYIDAQTDYACADGTVIPAVYVKVRAVMNSYGFGIGNEVHDHIFDWPMHDLSEDEAQAYVEMPLGKKFTAVEFAAKTGRAIDECAQYCDALYNKAWLGRIVNDLGTLYYHIPFVRGVAEYHTPEMVRGDVEPGMILGGVSAITGADIVQNGFIEVGSPFVFPVPCSPSVVKDGAIDPLDDVEKVWAQKNKFSLSPCFCRTLFGMPQGLELPEYPDGDWDLTGAKSVICDHDLYTCLSCGEEAQFWIDHGVGKEITYEEAMERLRTSVEQGMIIECTNSVEAETICSCHGDCCGAMSFWRAAGPTSRAYMINMRRYDLEVNTDTCAKCGACAERCPMDVIVMDEQTGYPVIGGDMMCMTCGQCAYVCPTSSRWLVPRDASTHRARFTDIVDQNNQIAAERFERGLIW